jgi:hypothetical protein
MKPYLQQCRQATSHKRHIVLFFLALIIIGRLPQPSIYLVEMQDVLVVLVVQHLTAASW